MQGVWHYDRIGLEVSARDHLISNTRQDKPITKYKEQLKGSLISWMLLVDNQTYVSQEIVFSTLCSAKNHDFFLHN